MEKPSAKHIYPHHKGAEATHHTYRPPLRVGEFWRHSHDYQVVCELVDKLGLEGPLLDAPAGTGVLSSMLQNKNFEVVAADLLPHNFEPRDIPIHRANLNERLPFEGQAFNSIVCREGVEHLEDQYNFIREANRVLKPGGKILITTPNMLSIRNRLAFLLSGNYALNRPYFSESATHGMPEHINFLTYFELRFILHTNGFRIFHVDTLRYSAKHLIFFWLGPFIAYFTLKNLQRSPEPEQHPVNREIFRHVTSLPLLLGKKLVIGAIKVAETSATAVRRDT